MIALAIVEKNGMLAFYCKQVIILALLVVLQACNNPVKEVKDSYWSGDDSVTIGKALDNYKYFDKVFWMEDKLPNGKVYVVFTAELKLTEQDIENMTDAKFEENRKKVEIGRANLRNNNVFAGVYANLINDVLVTDGTYKLIKEHYGSGDRLLFGIKFGYGKNNKKEGKHYVDLRKVTMASNKNFNNEVTFENFVIKPIFDNKPLVAVENNQQYSLYYYYYHDTALKAVMGNSSNNNSTENNGIDRLVIDAVNRDDGSNAKADGFNDPPEK